MSAQVALLAIDTVFKIVSIGNPIKQALLRQRADDKQEIYFAIGQKFEISSINPENGRIFLVIDGENRFFEYAIYMKNGGLSLRPIEFSDQEEYAASIGVVIIDEPRSSPEELFDLELSSIPNLIDEFDEDSNKHPRDDNEDEVPCSKKLCV